VTLFSTAAMSRVSSCRLQVRRRTDDLSVHRPTSRPRDVLALLAAVEIDAADLDIRAKAFQRFQTVLRLPVVPFDDMTELRTDLAAKRRVWQATQDWLRATDEWFAMSLSDTDVAAISLRVTQFAKVAMACERELPGNAVVAALRDRLAAFRGALPVIVDLRCDALKPRHWDEIHNVLGFNIRGDPNVTVGVIIRRGATRFVQQLARIAGEASAEGQLEVSLNAVLELWAAQEFTLVNYHGSRESLILGDLSEVEAALDESLMELTTLLGSRYITHLRGAVEACQARLLLLDDVCAELMIVQRHWVYLEQVVGYRALRVVAMLLAPLPAPSVFLLMFFHPS
jgi:dynein heavy chain, axonemal